MTVMINEAADFSADDHYDTPWEYKNKAISVALLASSSQLESTNQKTAQREIDENVKKKQARNDNKNGTSQLSPWTERPKTFASEFTTFSHKPIPPEFRPASQRVRPKNRLSLESSKTRNGFTQPPLFGLNNSVEATVAKDIHESSCKIPLTIKCAKISSTRLNTSLTSKIHEHPLTATALGVNRRSLDRQQEQQHFMASSSRDCQSHLPSHYPFVAVNTFLESPSNESPTSNESKRVSPAIQSPSRAYDEPTVVQQRREPGILQARKSTSIDLEDMIHEHVNRNDAETLLKSTSIGTFLLRRRVINQRDLALSLRASEGQLQYTFFTILEVVGVLHIKLELKDGLWVLGEGPRFSKV